MLPTSFGIPVICRNLAAAARAVVLRVVFLPKHSMSSTPSFVKLPHSAGFNVQFMAWNHGHAV